ncbi:uncharacterized protein TRUGW13939_10893 [Talaromyces rugulosus]|uniref:Uncharacterized protein n=1 Tax=Talaromyces rugulosus TaxID=121627 RepID=A0A7H8RBC0_TALRU|nr:uncharacterized protein TRUGW13939_10893 [Talaromyces rugulosus]QKX63722.1 hypothetical protein TRUGW13939_10893 [Talaromyces rugulosus]
MKTLSQNDKNVLSRIFESHPSGSLATSPIDHTLPTSLPSIPPGALSELRELEFAAISPLDGERPSQESLRQSIAKLTDLVTSYPQYSSAYNNRAQALRLLHGDDLYNEAIRDSTLWSDLCSAIAFASPGQSQQRVCELQGQILRSAYAQRGFLTWKAAKNSAITLDSNNLPLELVGLEKEAIEDKARSDLEAAGRYGDQEAKKMAISANPYARLCGNIVEEAMIAEMQKMRDSWNKGQSHTSKGN